MCRFQELSAYLEEFTINTEEIMDIIYHSMPTTWKNKKIEQGFNYTDSTIKEMTDIFETREENLEPKENKKKNSTAAKKTKIIFQEMEKGRLRLQSFFRQLRGTMCCGQQAQTEEKETFQDLWKEVNALIEEKFQLFV